MDNKIIGLMVAVVVSIIAVGGILMPVINDAAADTKTFDNGKESLYYMEKISDLDNYNLKWNMGANYIIVNGESINLPVTPNSYSLICVADEFILRYVNSPTVMQLIGITFDTDSNYGLEINIANGNLTFTNGVDTKEIESPNGYIISNKGDYVMKSPTQKAYIKSSSEILGMGITTLEGTWNTGFSITGTVSDLAVEQYSGNSYTISNVSPDYAPVSRFVDLYTIDKISFDIYNETSEYSDVVVYDYFIVPTKITATYSEPAALNEYSGLVYAIPVIVIVSILAMVAFSFSRRY